MSTISMNARGFSVNLRDTAPVLAAPITPEVSKVLQAIKSGAQAVVEFCGRHKVIIRAGVFAVALTIGFGIEEAFAAPDGMIGDAAQSGDQFDRHLRSLYYRLVRFAKWVVVIKGGFDTVAKTLDGDFVAARKSGIAYVLVYCILLGLPWLFDQVDQFFMAESVPTMEVEG